MSCYQPVFSSSSLGNNEVLILTFNEPNIDKYNKFHVRVRASKDRVIDIIMVWHLYYRGALLVVVIIFEVSTFQLRFCQVLALAYEWKYLVLFYSNKIRETWLYANCKFDGVKTLRHFNGKYWSLNDTFLRFVHYWLLYWRLVYFTTYCFRLFV